MGTGRSDEEVWACNSVEMKQMSSKCAVREQAKVRLNRCARLFTEYVTTHPTSPLLCDHSPTSSKIAKVTKVTVSESRGFLFAPLTNCRLARLYRVARRNHEERTSPCYPGRPYFGHALCFVTGGHPGIRLRSKGFHRRISSDLPARRRRSH